MRNLLALSLVACAAGAQPRPALRTQPTAVSPPPPPRGSVEPDTPVGYAARELLTLPAPDARAAKEDLPAGAACRIGSARFPVGQFYSDIVYPSADRLLVSDHSSWTVLDAASGTTLDDFKLGWITKGVSPSGSCVSVIEEETYELFRLPSRVSAGKRKLASDKGRGVVPSDDCSVAVQRFESSPCLEVYGALLEPLGKVCAGFALRAAALSHDGSRVALVPSQMTTVPSSRRAASSSSTTTGSSARRTRNSRDRATACWQSPAISATCCGRRAATRLSSLLPTTRCRRRRRWSRSLMAPRPWGTGR